MDWYSYADEKTSFLNRKYKRLFDGLKLLNFDELNVLPKVESVYKKSLALAKKAYLDIGLYLFLLAYEYAAAKTSGQETDAGSAKKAAGKADKADATDTAGKAARAAAEKAVTEEWLSTLLDEPNPVTGYIFSTEFERKKERLVEALSAGRNPREEIEKALRYWALQSQQYADEVTAAAMLEAYRGANTEYVRWVTEEDERVCLTCGKRHGKVYAIDEVPDKPHYRCRCWLEPVDMDDA